jgi:hypothetical protein
MTEERQPANAVLLNLAMDNAMRILSMPLPEPNDTSPAAKLVRALMTAVSDAVIAQAETPKADPRLHRAQALLGWLKAQPSGKARFREILQFGPTQTRAKSAVEDTLSVLKERGWVTESAGRPRTIHIVEGMP